MKASSQYDSFEESGYVLSHFTNLFHALFRCPALKSWGQRSLAYLISFTLRLDSYTQFVLFCAFYKASVTMYLCLTMVSFATPFFVFTCTHAQKSLSTYVYSDVPFSPAHVISWLHRASPSTYSNIINAACEICASRITESFPDQYRLFICPGF